MSENYLSHIIPTASSKLLKENPEYGFNILLLTPKDGKYQLVVTDGLRKNVQQNVSDDNLAYSSIELYFCLPDYFNLENESWPVEWLNRIAQVPQKNNTWFGEGDTLPAGNPPAELSEKFPANHFILSPPKFMKPQFTGEEWKENFNMLGIIPIFQKEIDYKLKNSHTMLFNKMKKHDITERVDIYRPNSCKKRFGIF